MPDTPTPSLFKAIALDFPPADQVGARVEYRLSPHQGLYGVDVYFVGAEPDRQTIDRVLRECLALAVAHDASRNVYADAYRLAHANADPGSRQTLQPYGPEHFLCFDARMKQSGVRRVGTRGFVADPQALLHTATADAAPDAAQEALDNNSEAMIEAVRGWVWYGSHSPAELDEQIEADAEDGEPFDLGQVRAFAAEELARKRSAEAQWPAETDCDRLDRAFERLHAQRICALHFPDTGYTLQHGQEAVTFALDDMAALGELPEGYCFYHGQDIERALDGEGLLLAFGSITEDDPAGDLRTGRQVCEALALEGLQPVWDGTAERRIAVPALQWRRRTPA